MNEVYAAIYVQLDGEITESVYDHVPKDLANADYPFVRLDPLQSENIDTDLHSTFSATIQVVGYSQYRGTKEISLLADSVYNALHRHDFPDTANYHITGMIERFRRVTTQPDGLTRHSVQQFELFFELIN